MNEFERDIAVGEQTYTACWSDASSPSRLTLRDFPANWYLVPAIVKGWFPLTLIRNRSGPQGDAALDGIRFQTQRLPRHHPRTAWRGGWVRSPRAAETAPRTAGLALRSF
ncbi:MAG TPA: hypothetical protein VGL59_04340, partial [Polyangia bacterium]